MADGTCTICGQKEEVRAVWLDENRTAVVCVHCVDLCTCGRLMVSGAASCRMCITATPRRDNRARQLDMFGNSTLATLARKGS